MSGRDVEIQRRVAEEDIATISALLHAAEHADDHHPLGEHTWLDLVQGGRSGYAGFVARERPGGRVVGYVHVSKGQSSWAIEFVVHPSRREPGDPVGPLLVAAAIDEIRAEGGGHVHLWVPKPDDAHEQIASANGLHRGRDLFQMRRPLPVTDHVSSVTTRPFVVGEDEESWLAVNNRAFDAHPEQGAWDLDTLRRREREPWFDAGGFLLHEVDGRVAASCWTKVHDDDPPLGEIYVISVDPAFQGRGLGRELVLAGLEHLAAEGLRHGMLYVDASNVPAVTLYEKLGFQVDHIDRAYVGDVRPA
ncbi:MAG TPA: mycothiol synthase [Acidimicrobiales bacterium]|nr:mycothiol synthase [Acidimicrobiales bacterium]